MTIRSWLPAILLAPLMAGCVNDSASYQNENGNQILTLVRQQRWLWEKKVEASMVVSRLPECQRRHKMGLISPQARVELWQPGPGTFLVLQGRNLYLTEVQTCEGWEKQDAEPPGGMGQRLGIFQSKGGDLRFIPDAPEQPAGRR